VFHPAYVAQVSRQEFGHNTIAHDHCLAAVGVLVADVEETKLKWRSATHANSPGAAQERIRPVSNTFADAAFIEREFRFF
jgi:hypothetical protein